MIKQYLLAAATLALSFSFQLSNPLDTQAMIAMPQMEVTEDWNNWHVDFTVGIFDSSLEIAAFAVGTDYAIGGATINQATGNVPEGWSAGFAIQRQEGWELFHDVPLGYLPTISSVELDLSALNDYASAFIYYNGTADHALTTGTWTGFEGWAQAPDSAFVAYDIAGNTIAEGETTPSVPLPGAFWLLGSSLAGFIGLRKKLNG